jgi:EAL domain-containing protein (putative c-di-GMP-specific phosphodiesterase class I)
MRLKLELTEGMLLENIEDAIATMYAVNEIGVQFSLDDFGTCYSSLQYLKLLPLNQLKIDQLIARDITTDIYFLYPISCYVCYRTVPLRLCSVE